MVIHTKTSRAKIYRLTNRFPVEEKYGLVSQQRHAAASIGANLMEGSHRLNRKEYRQFVGIARGSAGELKYHLLLSRDLEFIDKDEYCLLKIEVDEISKMTSGLANSLSISRN